MAGTQPLSQSLSQYVVLKTYPTIQSCTVVLNSLNIRTGPTTDYPIVNNYSQGTSLNFFEVVEGEFVGGNPYWGHSTQGHYYWMGGTDRPNG